MLSLYEIDSQLSTVMQDLEQWIVDHDGDFTDFPLNDQLNALQEDREKKMIDLACYIKGLEAEAEAFEEEKKKKAEIAKSLYAKADRIRAYLSEHIQSGEKFKDTRASIGWRKSEGLVVKIDVMNLPEEYIKFGEPTAKIAEMKTALKAGATIPGVELEQRQNLIIK